MIDKISIKIKKNFPFVFDEYCLLAISGGIDSMVMLDIFQKLDLDFEVVHCNFNLRGDESDLDEKFVTNYCIAHQIKYHIKSFNTESIAKELKLSIQETARNIRYMFFTELMMEREIGLLATAHNLNDSFETFMINLSRGTGIDGLLGIPTQNEHIIRPISFLTRDEIIEYANFYQISWREDHTNQETKYLRNKIRHQLFPIFKELNPSFLETFNKTLNNLKNTKILQEIALSDGFSYFIDVQKNGDLKLKIEPFLEFSENISTYLYGWFQEYGFKDWVAVENLLFAETGKRVDGNNCYLIKEKKHLVLKFKNFEKVNIQNDQDIFTISNEQSFVDIGVLLTQEVVEKESKATLNKIYVDLDLLKYPLFLRKKNKGDVIFPTGMNGSKKVSKFFKDQNISALERESTYILTTNDNQIIWIVGYRQDRRFLVSDNTNNIIKFEIK
ncbi:MAG: tRNA lysidine(34) synthetase TilS [Flavobacterium sp.]|jgi:tRNA(Ile)-lysidine synthase